MHSITGPQPDHEPARELLLALHALAHELEQEFTEHPVSGWGIGRAASTVMGAIEALVGQDKSYRRGV